MKKLILAAMLLSICALTFANDNTQNSEYDTIEICIQDVLDEHFTLNKEIIKEQIKKNCNIYELATDKNLRVPAIIETINDTIDEIISEHIKEKELLYKKMFESYNQESFK